MATKTYRVVTGLDHPKGRNEPGDVYTGPAKSVDWLLEQGAIVEDDRKSEPRRDAEGS
jgi:hypothetical protein